MVNRSTIKERLLDVLTGIAAVCAIVAMIVSLRDRTRVPALVGPDTTSVRVSDWPAIASTGRRIGTLTAPMTILEFGDFQCPACRSFERTLRGFLAAHPNDVSLVFRHWPLEYHNLAYPAARAAECAAVQGRFAEFHDLLYAKQDSLGLIPFREFAERTSVPDLAAFDRCTSNLQPVPTIQDDIGAAKRLVGSRGTPTVIVNGLMLGGIPDSKRLERLLADAETRTNNGTRRAANR